MSENNVTYTVTQLSEGFMAKCDINPEISVYGDTKEEAIGSIDGAIDEFKKLFPNRLKKSQILEQ